MPQADDEAQGFQRLQPAIHQVADKPNGVARRIEMDDIKQAPQRVVTALNIAYGVNGHGESGYKKSADPRAFLRNRVHDYFACDTR